MHTSNYTDIADTYIENIFQKGKDYFYRFEKMQKKVLQKKIVLKYNKNGQILSKTINALYTHHGPVMAKRNGQYLSLKSMNRSMTSLIQSWQRTKAKGFADYKKTMDLLGNTSNNTVYADAEGNIAYWHGNFLPKRNPKIDWTKPVDGSWAANDWQGLHPVSESVHVYNPPNGWLQNCNSTPFTCAGEHSPKKEQYPKYMAPDGENFRGINAVRVLSRGGKYDLDKVITAGYDTYLYAFEILVPALIAAYDNRPSGYEQLEGPLSIMRSWMFRCDEKSVAQTLAIEWAQRLLPKIQQVKGEVADEEDDQVIKTKLYVKTATPDELLLPFVETVKDLEARFGRWQVAWGDINRYQRISSDINQQYDDSKPSYPVAFASSTWGMLPSYNARYFNTKKRYGVNGNSFVCAVEFGEKIKAKSLLAGGQSGDMQSKHFNDQLEMYTKGQFKDVLFYKEDVLKHAERTYHPGE
jgi:acyl-homoserine-lactone acylase